MTICSVNNTIMNSITYILYSEDVDCCVLIDCGEYKTLLPVLEKIGKRVKSVLLTHGHFDHIFGLLDLLKESPAIDIYTLVCGHEEIQDSKKNLSFYHGYPFIIEGYVPKVISNGDILHFDGIADIEVFETPGHALSCVSYKVGKYLFTGDSYIPGIKVFSKFSGGDRQQALSSFALLSDLEHLGYIVLCGHHSFSKELENDV